MLRLLAVRRKQGRTTIFLIIITLGINQNRYTRLTPDSDDFPQQPVSQYALLVIRKVDHIKLSNSRFYMRDNAFFTLGRDVCTRFLVDPHNLLITGKHSGFSTGHPAGLAENTMFLYAAIFEPPQQKFSIIVFTNDTEDINLTVKGQQVIDDIAGTTKPQFLAFDFNDLDRSLGADAVDRTPDIFIKHQVADHQGSDLRDTGQELLQLRSIKSHDIRLPCQFYPELRQPEVEC